MRIGAIVGLIGGVVAGAFFLIKGIPLTSTGATLNNGAYLIGFGVGTIIGSLAEFIGTFALTEFIKVMMDIEANTRALLDRSP
jgi:energy-converting hydrogenase Eha subunit B